MTESGLIETPLNEESKGIPLVKLNRHPVIYDEQIPYIVDNRFDVFNNNRKAFTVGIDNLIFEKHGWGYSIHAIETSRGRQPVADTTECCLYSAGTATIDLHLHC